LPPVVPPSGRQILQLFIVPGIIVLVLVGLFLIGPALKRWMGLGGGRTPEQFLRDLDSNNADVRWRAASDLAQVLLREDRLASNPDFALALADRLQTALADSADAEKQYAARHDGLSEGEKGKALKDLDPRRNLIMYLGASLGNFMIPAGAPLLEQMATQTSGMEPDVLAERRRRALFALATLGENLKRYDKLSDDQKDEIEQKLKEAQKQESPRARATLENLQARRRGKADTMGVADTLAKCAEDDDPSLRFMAAFASNFWHGTAREEKTIEDFLYTLSNDSGRGAEQMEERILRNPTSKVSREVTTKPGFDVEANATIALARRGSPRVRVDLLKEMLDPAQLRKIFVIKPRSGAETPNEALVVLTLTDTLRAIVQLHQKRPEMKLASLLPLIDELAKSDNAAIRAEAKQAQVALK
jgi:hypothetical protein